MNSILTFINCNFTNNTAKGDGAIQSSGNLIINGSTFTNNNGTSDRGRTIYAMHLMNIINSNFFNNYGWIESAIINHYSSVTCYELISYINWILFWL